jgi:ribosomal protein S25
MPFNTLKAKPENISSILSNLHEDEIVTPFELVNRTHMSLTAVYGALDELERTNAVEVIRQNKTPRMQVKLSK